MFPFFLLYSCQAAEGLKLIINHLRFRARKANQLGDEVAKSRIGDSERLAPNPRALSSIPLLGYIASLRNSLKAGVRSQVQGGQTSQSTEP